MDNMISIIVPVYNVEEYLAECIYSILNQTYKYFELILIDDGSTDNSGMICDEFMTKDTRIRAFHKKNGGLSSARNAGMAVAIGDYYAFVDSDDYIEKSFIECLYKKAVEEDADICECGFSYLIKGKIVSERLFNYNVLDNDTAVRKLFSPPYQSFVNIWNKLYKKELFQDIKFPEGKLHEDEFTTYKLLYESKRVAYLNKSLYVYRIRNNSITTSGFSDKRIEVLDSIKEQRKYFNDRKVDMHNELQFHEFIIWIKILNMMVDSDCYDNIIWSNIRDNIRKNRKVLLKCPFLKRGHKMYVITLMLGRMTYKIFRKAVSVLN